MPIASDENQKTRFIKIFIIRIKENLIFKIHSKFKTNIMAKKILSLLIMFIIIVTLASCCKKSLGDIYFNANDIRVQNTNLFINIGDGVTVSQQDYRIKCLLSENIVEIISDINDLRASFDYCEDNYIGLKRGISNLIISCDKDIWNSLAGTPLDNNNIRIFENKFEEDSQNLRLTIQEWLAFVNNEDQLITFEWFIEFNEPIISTEYLKFQLRFEIADGSEYFTQTESVKIE